MSIDDIGKGTTKLSQVLRQKCAPYRGHICQSGRPETLESQGEPGLTCSAGPRGPSSAIPTNPPSLRVCTKCLTLSEPCVSDPRVTRNPRRSIERARISPSFDSETRACTPLSLNAAKLASKSRCQHPRTPGPKPSGTFKRIRRLRIHNPPSKAANFTFIPVRGGSAKALFISSSLIVAS